MTTVLSIGGAAVLFVLFGLLRRGREPEADGVRPNAPRRRGRLAALGDAEDGAPHALGRVYGDENHMREAARMLDRAKMDLGCESTVRRDLPVAEDKVKALIKIHVTTPGFIGALAVDGATFKYDHAIAIMLLSHQLQDPVLLRLLYPTHDGPYKAAHMAVDLKKVLATTTVRSPALRESQIAALAGNGMAVQSVVAVLLFIVCATRPVLPKQYVPLGVMANSGLDGARAEGC
jgi:hypothetical protein